MIETIIMIYAAILVVTYLHELGKGGTNVRVKKYLPPSIVSRNVKYRYGGVIATFAIALVIFYFKPEMFFISIIGLFAWKYFMYYSVLGMLHDKAPNGWKKLSFFNELTKQESKIMIPFVILSIILFRGYYLPILSKLIEVFI